MADSRSCRDHSSRDRRRLIGTVRRPGHRARRRQQQGSLGANVNIISGTGADGDWTLQRQNEPTMACSSRNPQNCLAGANDYRTVDIPFPTIGEKITGDAWLGWYTTKNGGLTLAHALLPGYPQDSLTGRPRVAAEGLRVPARIRSSGRARTASSTTAAWSSTATKATAAPFSSSRFIDNNNQEGTTGNRSPISVRRSSTASAPAPTVARPPGP